MLFELIDDLKELELIQGTHNGRWQDELDQEDSAKDYLKEMKKFADKYKVSYAPVLKDNFNEDYWDDEDFDFYTYMAMDELGFDLKCQVEKIINNKIKQLSD